MSTVACSSSRVIRSYARVLPSPKPFRHAPRPLAPFGVGLADDAVLVKTWCDGGLGFAVTEHEANPDHFRYFLYASRDGELVERKGFDMLFQAESYARHLSEPLPVVRPRRFEPTPEDRAWWARESESLAPVSGGSPESHAAAWSMPGEIGDEMDPEEFDAWLDSIYEDTPELSDDASGAFGGHDS